MRRPDTRHEIWLMRGKWRFPLMGCRGQNAQEVPVSDNWGILPQAPCLVRHHQKADMSREFFRVQTHARRGEGTVDLVTIRAAEPGGKTEIGGQKAMLEPDAFQALIDRVRAGDDSAATELVRRYEPMVRRAARVRLSDPRLGRTLDSMDICQSVMASFFVRAAMGQFELNSPDQLLKLLATMARNKLANQAHNQRAAKRDMRRIEAGGDEAEAVADRGATPSRQVAARELLDQARARLRDDERRLLDLRQDGANWDEIAAAENANPDALRKKLARAVDRVAQEIGLDGSDDG